MGRAAIRPRWVRMARVHDILCRGATELLHPVVRRALRALLGQAWETGRVAPLPRCDGAVSLLLTTDASPEAVAQLCLDRGGAWIESAQVRGKAVVVSFRPGAVPPETGMN